MHITLKRPHVAALLLLGILALHSCTRPNQQIGLGIQPEGDLLGANQTDTVSITSATVVIDSLRTDDLLFSLLGSYSDPDLGEASATLYTQVRLSSNNVDFGNAEDILLDSIVLAFEYGDIHHGRRNAMTFSVQEIAEDYVVDSTYYNNQRPAFYPTNIIDPARATIVPNTEDWQMIGGDSLPPQLRIHLDTNFAREKFLSQSGLESFENNVGFLEHFEGFKITPMSTDGGVFSLNLLDINSNLTMYYRDVSGEEPDTTSFVFNINELCSRHYETQFTRSNAIAGIHATDTLEATPYVYAQGGGNVATLIRFPHIQELLKVPGMVINKAELIIPVKSGTDRGNLPPEIYLRRPLNESIALLPEDLLPNFDVGGNYDPVNQEYRVQIARFLEHQLTGDIESHELLLMVEDRYALANTFVDPSLNRLVLHGPSVDPDESSANMRLILTHTIAGN